MFRHILNYTKAQPNVSLAYGPGSCVCFARMPGAEVTEFVVTLKMSKKKMMSNSSPNVASRLYALAVANDTANLVDVDAALALARASTRTIMALSPQAAELMRGFAQEEIDRLSMDCTEEAQGSIALIQDAINVL